MKKIDWVKINKEYKGLWIALDEEESQVVAFSKNAKEAYEKALEKGVKAPILFRVPEESLAYIGIIYSA